MRTLAADDALALPILSHPAFQGSFAVTAGSGLSHRVLYGRLSRLAGADAAIFPHFGGRFAYTEAQCRDIVIGCTAPMTVGATPRAMRRGLDRKTLETTSGETTPAWRRCSRYRPAACA